MADCARLLGVVSLLVVVVVGGGGGVGGEMCDRLVLSGLTFTNTAYIQFSGIYERQNYTYNDFPVIKRDNLLFFYMASRNRFEFGLTLGNPLGMIVTVKRGFDPKTWAPNYDSILDTWQEWYVASKTLKLIVSQDIRFVCTKDDDLQPCASRRFAFDKELTQHSSAGTFILNTPGQHYYEQIPHLYHNNRPVYELKNATMSARMYYQRQWGWVVGSAFPTDSVFIVTRGSTALTPSQVVTKWEYYNGKELVTVDGMNLRCQGVKTLLGESCFDRGSTCRNNGTCVRVGYGEEVCTCPGQYHGTICDVLEPKCPTLDFQELNKAQKIKYIDMINTGNGLGSLTTLFCPVESLPKYFYAVCEGKEGEEGVGKWKGMQKCSAVVTPRPTPATRPTRPPRPTLPRTTRRSTWPDWNRRPHYEDTKYEEPIWAYAVTMTVVMLAQLLLPTLIYFMLEKISERLDDKQTNMKLDHLNTITIWLTKETEKILPAEREGRITEAEAKQQKAKVMEKLAEKQQYYKEIRQKWKSKRKVKNIGWFRIHSLAFNVGLWFWLPIVIITSSTSIESETFNALWLSGVICLPICYLLMLIEAVVSREQQYLSGLSEVEYAHTYLKTLRDTPPHLIMQAECYHYETRTRTVYYTDANGNMQSRMETYQERVVTHVDSELFRYSHWMDTSDSRFAFSNDYGVTKIKLKRAILPGDDVTSETLSAAEAAFQDRNRNMDLYMDYNLNIEVEGYRQRLAAYVDEKNRAWWIGTGYFWLATLLLLSWPYRWIFRARTGSAKYKLEKRIFMTRPEVEDDVTAYDVTSEVEARLCASGEEKEEKEEKDEKDGGGKKADDKKRKSKYRSSLKDKGGHKDRQLKTDVDLEMGGATVNSYN